MILFLLTLSDKPLAAFDNVAQALVQNNGF